MRKERWKLAMRMKKKEAKNSKERKKRRKRRLLKEDMRVLFQWKPLNFLSQG